MINVTQQPNFGASKLALTGGESFVSPIVLSKQALTLPLYIFRIRA